MIDREGFWSASWFHDGDGTALADAGSNRAFLARADVMYVGSYTSEARGHGRISVYRRTREADAWSLIQVVKEFRRSSFLTIDRRGECLYSAHGDGTQAAFRIDARPGG